MSTAPAAATGPAFADAFAAGTTAAAAHRCCCSTGETCITDQHM
jgi:hypothetical protein